MERRMKRWKGLIKGITAFTLAMVMAMSRIPGTDFVLTAYADSDKTITGLCTGAIGNPDEENGGGWSYVYYGTYQGKQVKYRVLTTSTTDFEGRTMLLDCDSTIVNMQFGDEYYDNSNKWSDSAIIRWLHGNDFCESVFTKQENAAIASSVKVSAASGDGKGWSGKLGYAPLGGERIFLLDAVEATRPSYGYANTNASNDNRKKSGTSKWWWLRSPYHDDDDDDDYAGYVNPSGIIYCDNVDSDLNGVSPAFNINLGSVIFSSLISGSSGEAGAEYKLTLKDDDLGITPGSVTRDGSTITVPYTISGKNAGNATQVSVLVMDGEYSAGTAMTSGYSYKKLTVDSWSTSGTGTFTLPDEYAGKTWGSDYYVYILAEQAHTGNEIKLTDYASEPVEIKATSATGYEGTYDGQPHGIPEPEKKPDKVPVTDPTASVYASPEDNFAPVAPGSSGGTGGSITKLKLDFSKVKGSGVTPDSLKMTVIKGSKFTTVSKIAEGGKAEKSRGVKVKVNKKKRIATITCKSDGWVKLPMEDGVTYTVNFTVNKPKAKKFKLAVGSGQVIKTIKELFDTDIDSGTLTAKPKKNASKATVSADNTLIINPDGKDTIKVQYKYLNKKYKMSIKVK